MDEKILERFERIEGLILIGLSMMVSVSGSVVGYTTISSIGMWWFLLIGLLMFMGVPAWARKRKADRNESGPVGPIRMI